MDGILDFWMKFTTDDIAYLGPINFQTFCTGWERSERNPCCKILL